MTNLIATLIVTTNVQWSTVSTTIPVSSNPPGMIHAVVRHHMLNQVGRTCRETFAEVEFEGAKHRILVKTEDLNEPLKERSIPEVPSLFLAH